MKKFLAMVPLLILLGAGCTPKAPVPGSPFGPQPLPIGIVTIQGVYAQAPPPSNPDLGEVIGIETQAYGTVSVRLPGFIQCKSDPIYRPHVGETVEVHGNYANGTVDVCSDASYYIKKQ